MCLLRVDGRYLQIQSMGVSRGFHRFPETSLSGSLNWHTMLIYSNKTVMFHLKLFITSIYCLSEVNLEGQKEKSQDIS